MRLSKERVKELKEIAKGSFKNREALEKNEVCVCYHCMSIFPTSFIKEWADGQQTALCPHCEIDSVLAEGVSGELLVQLIVDMNYMSFRCYVNDDGELEEISGATVQ